VDKPLIIAHRGASAEAPENTLSAFRRAIASKADGIELDVQISKDGVPVVFHDDSLRRLTGVSGRLTAKTWPELQKLRVLQSDEGIPRLVDVLALTRGRIVVQIELKRGVRVEPVVAVIKKARATAWVILASFELELVCEAAKLAPKIPRMLISEGRRTAATLVRQLATCEAHGLSVNYRAVRNADYARYFQTRGFVVWCWTVNEAPAAKRLMGWGIDALLGDNPALLRSLI
jgi:glycerophosphoryl diester phosphodiesterase